MMGSLTDDQEETNFVFTVSNIAIGYSFVKSFFIHDKKRSHTVKDIQKIRARNRINDPTHNEPWGVKPTPRSRNTTGHNSADW